MLMKWEDLEAGDKVRIHPETLKYWRHLKCFIPKKYEKPHIISNIINDKVASFIEIIINAFDCDDRHIKIDPNSGREMGHVVESPFFEVVSLRKD